MAVTLTEPKRLAPAGLALIEPQLAEPWAPQEASLLRRAIETAAQVDQLSRRLLATVTLPLDRVESFFRRGSSGVAGTSGFVRAARAVAFLPDGISHVRARGIFWAWTVPGATRSDLTIKSRLRVAQDGDASPGSVAIGAPASLFAPSDQALSQMHPGLPAGLAGAVSGDTWRGLVLGPVAEIDVSAPVDFRVEARVLDLQTQILVGDGANETVWIPIAVSFWWELETAAGTGQDPGEVVLNAPIVLPHAQAAIEQLNWCASQRQQTLWNADLDLLVPETSAFPTIRGLGFTNATFRTYLDNACFVSAEPVTARTAVLAEIPAGTTCDVRVSLGSLQQTLALTSVESNKVQTRDFALTSAQRGLQRWIVEAKRTGGAGTCFLHQVTGYEVNMAAGLLQAPAND